MDVELYTYFKHSHQLQKLTYNRKVLHSNNNDTWNSSDIGSLWNQLECNSHNPNQKFLHKRYYLWSFFNCYFLQSILNTGQNKHIAQLTGWWSYSKIWECWHCHHIKDSGKRPHDYFLWLVIINYLGIQGIEWWWWWWYLSPSFKSM